MRSLAERLSRLARIVFAVTPLIVASAWLLAHLPGVLTAPQSGNHWFVFLAYGWTGIFLHEAGHALAGSLLGFRLSVFRVVPIEIAVGGNGRAQLKWHKRLGGGYLGLPKHTRHLPLRTLLITAGGPLANVFTFLICWMLLWTARESLGAVFGFVRGLMIFSLFSAVMNLAPFQFGGSKTDGRRLWEAALGTLRSTHLVS